MMKHPFVFILQLRSFFTECSLQIIVMKLGINNLAPRINSYFTTLWMLKKMMKHAFGHIPALACLFWFWLCCFVSRLKLQTQVLFPVCDLWNEGWVIQNLLIMILIACTFLAKLFEYCSGHYHQTYICLLYTSRCV